MDQIEEYICLRQAIRPNKENQEFEIRRRIKLDWVAFDKLGYILKNKNISQRHNSKVFDRSVLPVITHGA